MPLRAAYVPSASVGMGGRQCCVDYHVDTIITMHALLSGCLRTITIAPPVAGPLIKQRPCPRQPLTTRTSNDSLLISKLHPDPCSSSDTVSDCWINVDLLVSHHGECFSMVLHVRVLSHDKELEFEGDTKAL